VFPRAGVTGVGYQFSAQKVKDEAGGRMSALGQRIFSCILNAVIGGG